MSFNEEQITVIKNAGAKYLYYHRPPLEIRDELDLAYKIEDQSVHLFEIRPNWMNPEEKVENSIAKTTFIKSKKLWKIYWMRSDLKWHLYKPTPFVKEIADFFDLVAEDKNHCFFG